MNVFILHAHPEPKSFNAALTQTAVEFLKEKGHKVQVSDFTVMNFDPVSDQRNFTSIRNSDFSNNKQRNFMHPRLMVSQETL
jgi:NAD(P)H dehydrogenase (quinone)